MSAIRKEVQIGDHDFCSEDISRILAMPAGSSVVYHVGLLAADKGPTRVARKSDEQRQLSKTADLALKLQQQGKVILSQKCVGDDVFIYRATRTAK